MPCNIWRWRCYERGLFDSRVYLRKYTSPGWQWSEILFGFLRANVEIHESFWCVNFFSWIEIYNAAAGMAHVRHIVVTTVNVDLFVYRNAWVGRFDSEQQLTATSFLTGNPSDELSTSTHRNYKMYFTHTYIWTDKRDVHIHGTYISQILIHYYRVTTIYFQTYKHAFIWMGTFIIS